MRNKSKKYVTFQTTYLIWQDLKVEAYRQGKTVKQFLNELVVKVLKEIKEATGIK